MSEGGFGSQRLLNFVNIFQSFLQTCSIFPGISIIVFGSGVQEAQRPSLVTVDLSFTKDAWLRTQRERAPLMQALRDKGVTHSQTEFPN